MIFTVDALRACSGGNHIEIDVTFNGGASRTVYVTRSEILDEVDADNADELRRRAILRMISRVKESTTGTPTPLQVRNALVGQTFEV
jgi:hypothetical protein